MLADIAPNRSEPVFKSAQNLMDSRLDSFIDACRNNTEVFPGLVEAPKQSDASHSLDSLQKPQGLVMSSLVTRDELLTALKRESEHWSERCLGEISNFECVASEQRKTHEACLEKVVAEAIDQMKHDLVELEGRVTQALDSHLLRQNSTVAEMRKDLVAHQGESLRIRGDGDADPPQEINFQGIRCDIDLCRAELKTTLPFLKSMCEQNSQSVGHIESVIRDLRQDVNVELQDLRCTAGAEGLKTSVKDLRREFTDLQREISQAMRESERRNAADVSGCLEDLSALVEASKCALKADIQADVARVEARITGSRGTRSPGTEAFGTHAISAKEESQSLQNQLEEVGKAMQKVSFIDFDDWQKRLDAMEASVQNLNIKAYMQRQPTDCTLAEDVAAVMARLDILELQTTPLADKVCANELATLAARVDLVEHSISCADNGGPHRKADGDKESQHCAAEIDAFTDSRLKIIRRELHEEICAELSRRIATCEARVTASEASISCELTRISSDLGTRLGQVADSVLQNTKLSLRLRTLEAEVKQASSMLKCLLDSRKKETIAELHEWKPILACSVETKQSSSMARDGTVLAPLDKKEMKCSSLESTHLSSPELHPADAASDITPMELSDQCVPGGSALQPSGSVSRAESRSASRPRVITPDGDNAVSFRDPALTGLRDVEDLMASIRNAKHPEQVNESMPSNSEESTRLLVEQLQALLSHESSRIARELSQDDQSDDVLSPGHLSDTLRQLLGAFQRTAGVPEAKPISHEQTVRRQSPGRLAADDRGGIQPQALGRRGAQSPARGMTVRAEPQACDPVLRNGSSYVTPSAEVGCPSFERIQLPRRATSPSASESEISACLAVRPQDMQRFQGSPVKPSNVNPGSDTVTRSKVLRCQGPRRNPSPMSAHCQGPRRNPSPEGSLKAIRSHG